jgi:uncharacterized repeat protein (TIGR01451 family)
MSRQAWPGRAHLWASALILVAVAAGLSVFLPSAFSQDNPKQVQICHATSSKTNPYVSQDPAIEDNGDLKGGHLNHTGPVFPSAGWGDIIPPYTYVDADGNTQVFAGYNWSPEGQAIWQHGCEPGPDPLTPTLECIEPLPGGGFRAHFGYVNPNSVTISDPPENIFEPLSADGLQPTDFEPGAFEDVFQVQSDGSPLTWHLTGHEATATAGSPHCQGSLALLKLLNPKGDSGRFDLEIDGTVAGGATRVGDGGTTGAIAVDTGSHTVGESAAADTDLADYDTQITCVSGTTTVAEGIGSTLSVHVGAGQAIACAITNTHKAVDTITPRLECVVFQRGAPSTAVWGYDNPNGYPVTIPLGATNGFVPVPVDRGQPTVFQPGRLVGAFQTPFRGAASLVWTVGKSSVTADSGSPPCTATLELRKVTVPANDPGFFDLQINGQTWAVGGNGTTTGAVTVGVGEGTVSETAAPGTNLADYDSAVECSRNGTVEIAVPGTKVDGTVRPGDVVVCTFTNTRKATVPQVPPDAPQPPQPPQPPLPPPPAPDAPLGDLSVTKTAAPTTAVLGQTIHWTVTVTNNSTLAAADVDVVRTTELTFRLKVISVTPSQGSCSLGTCNLGRLAPGASATIRIDTRATATGRVLNAVRVSSEEQESNYLNNTAAAVVLITASHKKAAARAVKAAAASRACRTLLAAPHVLPVGVTSIVLAQARSRFGRPLRGLAVQAVGLGLDERATTDSHGFARFELTPSRLGIIEFLHGSRLPAGVRSSCRTLLGVLGNQPPTPVTG